MVEEDSTQLCLCQYFAAITSGMDNARTSSKHSFLTTRKPQKEKPSTEHAWLKTPKCSHIAQSLMDAPRSETRALKILSCD